MMKMMSRNLIIFKSQELGKMETTEGTIESQEKMQKVAEVGIEAKEKDEAERKEEIEETQIENIHTKIVSQIANNHDGINNKTIALSGDNIDPKEARDRKDRKCLQSLEDMRNYTSSNTRKHPKNINSRSRNKESNRSPYSNNTSYCKC